LTGKEQHLSETLNDELQGESFTTNPKRFFNIWCQRTHSIRHEFEDIVMPVIIPKFKLGVAYKHNRPMDRIIRRSKL